MTREEDADARASSRSSEADATSRAHAFEVLARAHTAALQAFALRICRDGAEAHDLVQDTLERGLRNFERLTPGTNPRAWLFTILHNLFIDRCRKRRRDSTSPLDDLDPPAPEPDDAPPAWTSITREELAAAVEQLDEEFRVVYRMHALEGRSYLDISQALGVPTNTVGSRMNRARQKLRVLLERRLGTVANGGGSP